MTTLYSTLVLWQCVFVGAPADASPRVPEIPEELRQEPGWREPMDCGPLSLLALMNLEGFAVSLVDVKQHLAINPENGCSLEDLRGAAEKLGVQYEIRYVNAHMVKELSPPFLLHGITSIEKNLGHFRVIVTYDAQKGNYSWISTDRQGLSVNPEAVVLRGYTGYVLVPGDRAITKITRWLGYAWLMVGVGALAYWGSKSFPFLASAGGKHKYHPDVAV